MMNPSNDTIREPLPFTDNDGKRLYQETKNFQRKEISRSGKKGFEITADTAIVYEDGSTFAVLPAPCPNAATRISKFLSDEGAESEEELSKE